MKKLIEADRSLLDIKDNNGHSPLQVATIAGNRPIVETLVKNNADIMSRDNEGHTPAHWATGEQVQ